MDADRISYRTRRDFNFRASSIAPRGWKVAEGRSMAVGLRVLGDNGRQCIGNNTVETGNNGQLSRTIELASYLTARWRRSSANWFPMLPPLPRDKTASPVSSSSSASSPTVSCAFSFLNLSHIRWRRVSTFLILANELN